MTSPSFFFYPYLRAECSKSVRSTPFGSDNSGMADFAQRLQQRGDQFRDLNAKIKELQWVDSQFRKAGIEKERLSKVVAKRQAELEALKKITCVLRYLVEALDYKLIHLL
jgi:hypothetical protein